jgi:hypothetical protein
MSTTAPQSSRFIVNHCPAPAVLLAGIKEASMSVHAPGQAGLSVQQPTNGIFGLTNISDRELQLIDIAEYAACVLGGFSAWMSWQHSRQS